MDSAVPKDALIQRKLSLALAQHQPRELGLLQT